MSVDSVPVVHLRFAFGIFGAKQIGDGGEAGSIAVFQNPQALGRLIDGGSRSLQGQLRRPALDMSLVHLQPDLLLIGVQLRIETRLGRFLFCKLGTFAEREEIDANLHSSDPVVPALSAQRLPVIFPISVGTDPWTKAEASGTFGGALRRSSFSERSKIVAALNRDFEVLFEVAPGKVLLLDRPKR